MSMNWYDIASASVTLFLIMDPLGNVPVFNAVLSSFDARKRTIIVARELVLALLILLGLFSGPVAIAAHVLPHLPVTFQYQRRGNDIVQKLPVMTHQYQGTLVIGQQLLQQFQGLNIQVIGWLIQEQDIALFFQGHGQVEPVSLPSRKHAYLFILFTA